jgi:hypothetical protein
VSSWRYIHGHIGPLQEGVGIIAMIGIQRDADTSFDVETERLGHDWTPQRGGDALCHGLDLGWIGKLGQHHAELVPA